jgi:tRNA1Val (adenine37-N6)-methyltransferase
MSNPFFRFKQFTIRHDQCAMKVGTDGVLLGAWAEVAACRTILDVGAGTGLIALMVAQRNENAVIDGVEIDPDTYRQAAENVAASPFAQRVRMYQASFHDFACTTTQRYDLIISNPPYFVRSLKCPDDKRRLARHSDELSLAGLVAGSIPLLSPGGRLALILPFLQRDEPGHAALSRELHCVRRTEVSPVENAAPKRLLAEFSLLPPPAPVETGSLILEDARHQRTTAYYELTRDFYL